MAGRGWACLLAVVVAAAAAEAPRGAATPGVSGGAAGQLAMEIKQLKSESGVKVWAGPGKIARPWP